MPRCVAVFCGNTGDAGLGMFSFPKDPELNLVWRQNMKRTKSAREPNKLWENTVHSKLCGAHFDESCFQKVGPEREKLLGWKPGKRALVQGAIPTIFKRSVNDPLLKTKPVRSAFMKRERKEVHVHNIFAAFYQFIFPRLVTAKLNFNDHFSAHLIVQNLNGHSIQQLNRDSRSAQSLF